MYAIIRTGGKQYKVEKGSVLKVEKLDRQPGEKFNFEDILLVSDGGKVFTSAKDLEKVTVSATVQGTARGPKIIVFKYKPKKNYRKKQGHRQSYTEVKIEDVKMRKTAPRKKAAGQPAEPAREAEEVAVVAAEEKVTENV